MVVVFAINRHKSPTGAHVSPHPSMCLKSEKSNSADNSNTLICMFHLSLQEVEPGFFPGLDPQGLISP